MTVGKRVRQLRLEHGLSQHALAVLTKTSIPTISRLERGACDTSLSILHRIAWELDTSVSALLETETQA